MPKVRPNRFTRWLGRTFLRAGGWRVVGTLPDIPKLVLIVAPHSSNWDGIWGMAAKIALGFRVRVLGKAQLFWWPLGPLLRKLGAVPVDRSSPQGTVEQAVQLIRDSDRMWFALTPEGTRKRVEKWKSGFWKIAKAADVPILMAYFHYPDKIIGIGEVFHPGDDMDADMRAIREWYRPWVGKNRGTY
ncbi:acyltransferase [Pseudoxanthomonas kalamensis DSM 18571]|uniref:lysophospholipid acyltransferase family protein n=1 Tax=Pseudoxanthomonas kalamensis TaxID=289483 RepID=UPI0013911025|nr:lysophospholipid acyltransferase family protein [Pseudoxanthomonas kalamensis]KAF1712692.1 acyltransferase [Pseudoxanthomonas kalamensis DSM 18571]